MTRRSYWVELAVAPLVVRGASGTSKPGGFGTVDFSPKPGNPLFEPPLEPLELPLEPDELPEELPEKPKDEPDDEDEEEEGEGEEDDGVEEPDAEPDDEPEDGFEEPLEPLDASRAAFRFSIASIILATGTSRDRSRPASFAAPSRKYLDRLEISDGSSTPLPFSSIRPM
jgi:hypothetical protein